MGHSRSEKFPARPKIPPVRFSKNGLWRMIGAMTNHTSTSRNDRAFLVGAALLLMLIVSGCARSPSMGYGPDNLPGRVVDHYAEGARIADRKSGFKTSRAYSTGAHSTGAH